MEGKKRVLFCGEASPLVTGFAIYWREVISRLYKTGKYEIAELGSYMASNDSRANSVPWKFYGVMPTLVPGPDGKGIPDPKEDAAYKKNYKLNQFGAWKFDETLLDFRPDLTLDVRDPWMVEWQNKSPLRKYFKWALMACIDGHPEKPQWIKMFEEADALLTYSEYGKKVLKDQSPNTEVFGIASPGVDTDVFVPMDKESVRDEVFTKDARPEKGAWIIGTVMRNQQRKLYPRLILSFKKMLKELKAQYSKKNIKRESLRKFPYLLFHTSIPDVGWDIPLEVARQGLSDRVFFTYMCRNCDHFHVDKWRGETAPCPKCGAKSMTTPNTQRGLDNHNFAKIYNIMDLYVQASVCEGWGMPITEAKGCGVPIMAPNWSAMEDHVKGPGSISLDIATTFTDNGTMQLRSLFDEKDFVKKAIQFFSHDIGTRNRMGAAARESVIGSWDKAAKVWENLIDATELLNRKETWDAPPKIWDSELPIPKHFGDDKFSTVRWLYENVLNDKVDEDGVKYWMKCGAKMPQIEKFFREKARQIILLEKQRCNILPKKKTIVSILNSNDKMRILYAMPETAGDVLLSTAVVNGIKKKWPEASIYFLTKPEYQSILTGNGDITGVFDYTEDVLNYRATEGCANEKGLFDIAFTPFIVTQKIPHWLHNGHGAHLAQTYAQMCGVELGSPYIKVGEIPEFIRELGVCSLPYITMHSGSSLGIKDYEFWKSVCFYIRVPIIQVGMLTDPVIPTCIDARGKTTPQELAAIIAGGRLHIGVDSFPAHVAGVIGAASLTLFGPTFPNLCRPIDFCGKGNQWILEPKDRNGCIKPCHFSKCKNPKGKCINNILPYNDVVMKIREIDSDLVDIIGE